MSVSLSVLENQNYGFLPSTMADTTKPLFQDNNPVGTLPAQSSRGGSWIQDLSEPFNAYFRSLENQRLRDFSLERDRQDQANRISLENIRTKTAIQIATALVFGAVLFAAFGGKGGK
jgi:hypothetical protein